MSIFKVIFCLVSLSIASKEDAVLLLEKIASGDRVFIDNYKKSVPSGSDVITQFCAVTDLAVKTGIANKNSVGMEILDIFQNKIENEINESSLGMIESLLIKNSFSVESRFILLKSMMKKDGNLTEKGKKDAIGIYTKMLTSDSIPRELKILVLKKVGMNPRFTNLDIYFNYLNSEDSLIRASALRGLSQIIRTNKSKSRRDQNRLIFNKLILIESIGLDLIKAISEIDEDYSRDFLFDISRNDEEKIKAILFSSETTDDTRFIIEGLILDTNSKIGGEMSNAIRHSVRQPKVVINKLFAGDSLEFLYAYKLLSYFPEVVRSGQEKIREQFKSSDPQIRSASLRLIPYFENPKKEIEDLKAENALGNENFTLEVEYTTILSGK